jgi:hypothetical protein
MGCPQPAPRPFAGHFACIRTKMPNVAPSALQLPTSGYAKTSVLLRRSIAYLAVIEILQIAKAIR